MVITPSNEVSELNKGSEQPAAEGDFDEGLAHSIVEGNEEKVSQGQMLESSINQGMFNFNPDMMFDKLVESYSNAEKMYGEGVLRAVTGEDPNSLKKNLKFPEYQRELKNKMKKKAEAMRKDKLIDKDGTITSKGFELAALTLYTSELDKLEAKGLGERKSKDASHYGERGDVRTFKKSDRYKDIAIKKSIKSSIRRGHSKLLMEDLKVHERESRGKIYVIYGLDASGSMKGSKIGMCKKAGVALAFRAIQEKDRVGLLVFGSEIEDVVYPTSDFSMFLKSIVKIRAKKQTDIAKTVERAIRMFPSDNVTKHLVLITDAVPTVGDDPFRETINLVSSAKDSGITVSVIGIGLDEEGVELSKKIVEIGGGRLYVIKDLENLDTVVLEDYYSL